MTSLESLPNEILSHIGSYLRAVDAERLVKTFNRRLAAIYTPFLKGRRRAAKNARRMLELIRPVKHEDDVIPYADLRSAYAASQLSGTYGRYRRLRKVAQAPFPTLDYLDLRGTLEWLGPLDERTANEQTMRERSVASQAELRHLADASRQLGLVLPPCFVRFMGDVSLQNRVPRLHAEFVYDPLVKIQSPGRRQGFHVDGYAVRFYTADLADYNWYLFLDKHGGECVIGSANDAWAALPEIYGRYEDRDVYENEGINGWTELSPLEEELAVCALQMDVGKKINVFATSFEAFLATVYHAAWSDQALSTEDGKTALHPVPKSIEEFLINVCTKYGCTFVS
jgi:hypothetical protein